MTSTEGTAFPMQIISKKYEISKCSILQGLDLESFLLLGVTALSLQQHVAILLYLASVMYICLPAK